MDDTIPSSSLDDESVDECHRNKRHQGRRIETSLSYPEVLVRDMAEEQRGGIYGKREHAAPGDYLLQH